MNNLIRYFDLVSNYRRVGHIATSESQETKLTVLPQYAALLVGIIVQPFLQEYINTKEWKIESLGGWAIASIFISLMAFPAVYKNSIDATKPLFVQLCVIFTAGMGWQTIVNLAQSAT